MNWIYNNAKSYAEKLDEEQYKLFKELFVFYIPNNKNEVEDLIFHHKLVSNIDIILVQKAFQMALSELTMTKKIQYPSDKKRILYRHQELIRIFSGQLLSKGKNLYYKP